ncbi:MAG: grasp-with-spasm system ATP-grasp peptide maturase [Flavobacteriaceae bacterium]|nr:grasp-with-spasm system ATP-grasp peptide maturase [Flavobacteriaceae bacterium]
MNIFKTDLNDAPINNFKFKNNNYFLEVGTKEISLIEISSVWYRRGNINLSYSKSKDEKINRILSEERSHLRIFLNYILENKRNINKKNDIYINKLITLCIAKKNNLLIPKSYFNSKEIIDANGLITKTIGGGSSFIKDNKLYNSYTSEITNEELNQAYQYIYTQEKIKKKYELRIFYLHGKFWSMAIFSQKDQQTQVDFRRYNHQTPNRNVPYQLPKNIELKLHKLMQEININCGSIDMILTPKDEFYFLEVNPIGQFGMTSLPCNYHIENEISNYLAYGK